MSDLLTANEAADVVSIQRTLARVGSYADQKRWEDHRRLFTDEITVDFGGVKPAQRMTSQHLQAWSAATYANVQTQHMFTNQDVELDGDVATANSYGRALHERTDTGETWMIYARYEHTLVREPSGWKVTRLMMTPTWQAGRPDLLEQRTGRSDEMRRPRP
jgi:hypothetical protein